MGSWVPRLGWVWVWKWWIEMRFKLAGLESKLVRLDDGATTIHCWVPKKTVSSPGEAQKPALLLLQGFGMDGAFGWDGQAPAFAKRFRVYVPDLLFFGKSVTSEAHRSEEFQADCMKKMLDELAVDRAHVVGTSYGGMVAYFMAHKYPKVVDRLVVASSGVLMKPETNNGLLKTANVSSIKELLVPKDVKMMKLGLSIASVWPIRFVPNFVLQDMYNWFYNENVSKRAEILDGMVIGSKGAPPVPVVSQDVLILWGTKDRIFDPKLGEQLKAHLGDKAQLIYVPRTGHVPQVERSRTFNSHVLKFLSN